MLEKFNIANSSNSGKPLTDNAEGNPERSPEMGTCNDYSERKYTQAGGNGEHLNSSAVDGDIVFSAWRHAAAQGRVNISNIG